jgi:hypothetical protein
VPPAAQISAARRATGCPATSARSSRPAGVAVAAAAGASPAPDCRTRTAAPAAKTVGSPRSQPTTAPRLGALTTSMPGTSSASAALSGGTTACPNPAAAAPAIDGSTPGTGRRPHFKLAVAAASLVLVLWAAGSAVQSLWITPVIIFVLWIAIQLGWRTGVGTTARNATDRRRDGTARNGRRRGSGRWRGAFGSGRSSALPVGVPAARTTMRV